eukprot:266892_1
MRFENNTALSLRCVKIRWTQNKYWTRYFSDYFKDKNQVSNALHHNRLINSQIGKQLLGQDDVRAPISSPTGINTDIKAYINNSDNSKDILSIMEQNVSVIEHVSIFSKAMKKCDDLRDWHAVHEMMKLLLSSTLHPDRISFNIFFNCMSHADAPELAIKYFDVMVNEYLIKPDVLSFSSIIKSFRWQGRLKQAETFWYMMHHKYHLEPHELLYTEMISIYAKCRETEKGTKLFNEYLDKVQKQLLRPEKPVYGAYLNVFSRSGDIEGMIHANALICDAGFPSDVVTMTDVMRGYLVARNEDGCLDVLEEWLSYDLFPALPMMHLKCLALAFKIARSKASFEDKHAMFLEIRDTIHKQLKYYELGKNALIVMTELDGAIFLYRFHDPKKIIPVFNDVIQTKLVDYRAFDHRSKQYIIDFHAFQASQVQFIIRYLIGFELDKLLKILIDDELVIVVGLRRHSGERKTKRKGGLKVFLKSELKSWNPPINCYENKIPGRVNIHKSDLLPYLNKNNYAKKLLTEPSKHWHQIQ